MHPIITILLAFFNIYLTWCVFFPSFKQNLERFPKGSRLRHWLWKGVVSVIVIWYLVLLGTLDFFGILEMEA
jgi:hypothetical protein